MNHYRQFRPEDFVWDDPFRQWVLAPTRETDQVWKQWLAENPEQAISVQQAREVVLALQSQEIYLSDQEIRRLIQNTRAKLSQDTFSPAAVPGKPLYRQVWFRIAASVVLIVAVSAGMWLFRGMGALSLGNPTYPDLATQKVEQMVERVNHENEPLQLVMEDGSRISLKKGSRISYREPFAPDKREVYLSGEAFFEVASNPDRPFLVYANELVTKVLGTSFWIRAYAKSKEITVRVKTGRVTVFSKFDPMPKENPGGRELRGVILSPNQKIVYARKEIRMVKTLVAKPRIISTNPAVIKFEFEDTSVNEVFALLQEAYGVEILYNKETMKGCPITADLGTLTLYEKLDVICKAIEAEYEIIDGQIVIHGKGCKN